MKTSKFPRALLWSEALVLGVLLAGLVSSRAQTNGIPGTGATTNYPPRVTLISPTNGTVIVIGNTVALDPMGTPGASLLSVPLAAQASDQDGRVLRVDFYDGTNKLASVTNAVTNTAGVPPQFLYQAHWINPALGTHSLRAKAYDNLGKVGESAVATVKVLSSEPPTVSIVAVDALAAEGACDNSTSTNCNHGAFKITLSHPVSAGIEVLLDISGTASNGVDYLSLPRTVALAPGEIGKTLYVRPIEDTLVEGRETVVVGVVAPICVMIYPPPVGCYRVASSGAATVILEDNDTVSNQPPVVTLTKPVPNSNYRPGSNIVFRAEASDPDGTIRYFHFLCDSNIIASMPGNNAGVYEFVWTNPPPGPHVLQAKAMDNLQAFGVSAPVPVTVEWPPTNLPPVVTLLSPTNGSIFVAPEVITLTATARDPDGAVARVAFYDGTNCLGVVSNSPAVPPVDVYTLRWLQPSLGTHSLRAKVWDNLGRVGEGAWITVTVRAPECVQVSMRALDHIAAEGGTTANSAGGIATNLNTASFEIFLGRALTNDLSVWFEVGGTASNGVDYVALAAPVVVPAGRTNLVKNIVPIDDKLVEGREYVVVRLMIPQTLAPVPIGFCYQINPAAAVAEMVIEDNDLATNAPPKVTLLAPKPGAVYVAPAAIEIAAEASDSDGQVSRVDFYAGDRWVGADTAAPYSMVWSNVPSGAYAIRARAMDNAQGMAWSATAQVMVKSPLEVTFVKRSLPQWYVPGVKMVVRLRAEPRPGTTNYLVQDLPPAGWTLGAVLEGAGQAPTDPAQAGVVFGPFSDGLPRSFAYEVTPPAGGWGEQRFGGTGVANGLASLIGGVSVIRSVPTHPADVAPTNHVLAAGEVEAYAQAWLRGGKWAVSPNPIPVNYLTRAGYLLRSGGAYVVATNSPMLFPPMVWVPAPSVIVPASDTTAAGTAPNSPWMTNGYGMAYATMPTNYVPGASLTVTLTVRPTAAAKAYALEDRPPEGWLVTTVSEGGAFCPVTRKVKWGVYLDNTNRVMSYQVVPGTNSSGVAYFAGVASFDGVNVPVLGQRRVLYYAPVEPPRLPPVKTLATGERVLRLMGQVGSGYTIQGSTNLVDWVPLDSLLNSDGAVQFMDTEADAPGFRYYRAVPAE